MKKCFNCNIEYSDKDLFCEKCGKQLEECEVCPNCKKGINSDDKFCSYCGFNLLEGQNLDVNNVEKNNKIDEKDKIKMVHNKVMKFLSVAFISILFIGFFELLFSPQYNENIHIIISCFERAEKINKIIIILFVTVSFISLILFLVFGIIGYIIILKNKDFCSKNKFVFLAFVFYIILFLLVLYWDNEPSLWAQYLTYFRLETIGIHYFYLALFLVPFIYAIDKLFSTLIQGFNIKLLLARTCKYLVICLNIVLLIWATGNTEFRFFDNDITIILNLIILIYILISFIIKLKSKETSSKMLLFSIIDNVVYMLYMIAGIFTTIVLSVEHWKDILLYIPQVIPFIGTAMVFLSIVKSILLKKVMIEEVA